MPHENYMKRLINATQHSSGGPRPLINRHKRGEDEEEEKRRSPRLSKGSDGNRTGKHDAKQKKKSPLASRALAALQSDSDSEPSEEEDEQRDRPSSRTPATNNASRAAMPGATMSQRTNNARFSTPPRNVKRIRKEVWEARVKQDMHNYSIMSSPGSSVSVTSRSSHVNNARHSPANNARGGLSPSISIASAKSGKKGRSVANFELTPRIAGVSVTNAVAATETRAMGSHHGPQNGSHKPVKSDIRSPPRMNRKPATADNNPRIALGNHGAASPGKSLGLIDLTADSTGESRGDSGVENEEPTPRVNNTQTVLGHVAHSTLAKPQKENSEKHDNAMPCDEIKKTLDNQVVVLPSNQRQNQVKPRKLLELGEKKADESKGGKKRPIPLSHNDNNDQAVIKCVADSKSSGQKSAESNRSKGQQSVESSKRQQNGKMKDSSLSEKPRSKSPPKNTRPKESTAAMPLVNSESSDQAVNKSDGNTTPKKQHNDEMTVSPSKKLQNKSPPKNVVSNGNGVAMLMANNEHSDQTVNQRIVDSTSSSTSNEQQSSDSTKGHNDEKKTSSLIKPSNNNAGSKDSVATMLPANSTDTNQAGNRHVADSASKKQQNDEKKMSSPKKPKNKSPRKNARSKKASRKSSTTKKATANKFPAPPTCSLTGTLSYCLKDGNRCHIIRGLWEYENQVESTPQRFVLRHEAPSEGDLTPLTSGGIFSGYFIYRWAPKEKPETTLVIEEHEVHLSFTEKEGEVQSFTLSGTGQNQVGKFDLIGTATKMPTQELYSIQMRKKYTERFPSPVVPSQGNGDANNKKRKFSVVDASTGSESSGSQREGNQPSSEGETLSTEESSSFNDAVDASLVGKTASKKRQRGNAVLLLETARRPTRKVTKKKVEKKYDYTRRTSLEYRLLNLSENCTSSDVFHQDAHIPPRSSQDYGAFQFQRVNPFFSTGVYTWNVRNVKPKYSPMILDYFDSVGIVNVQDFLEADTDSLCLLLLTFDQFKAACAFQAWKSRTNRHDSNIANRTFRDLYHPEIAKQTVLTWKRTAETWYKRIAPAEPRDKDKANDMQNEVASETREALSGEDQAQGENAPIAKERRSTDVVEGFSEKENACSDDSVPLKNILSSYEALALKDHCNIHTAQELLAADSVGISRRLAGVVSVKFPDHSAKYHENIAEGMLFSWLLRAQGAVQIGVASTKISSCPPQSEQDADVHTISFKSTPPRSSLAFQTPLSHFDLQFIKSQHISSDGQIAYFDPSLLAHRYATYFSENTHSDISSAEALEVTKKWRQGARLVLGIIATEENVHTAQQKNTLLDSRQQDVMHLVPNLCKTVADKENEGLPTRTVFTYDDENYVLYEFSIVVKDSLCSSEAGNGAFFTYKGAKILRSSSKWKKKGPRSIPRFPQTRRPMEASFSTSGATVTLRGNNLHGDERHYGPEKADSVGLYREFTLSDFVDAEDNISFSSNHVGCALIELDRYAPLLPEDRKTDQLFSFKDFIFSHEPSSWRFDVSEELNGYPQVVDFTDDTTGAPHNVAKSHMSMYVNEVGHNSDLVESVHCLGTSRSVSYYIDIETPMSKGETIELLVNYKGHYEAMRERRGYGKANLYDGVKSDAHDITRVQRNLKDRFLTEESIFKLTEDEILRIMDFFKTRVWNGLKAATSTLANSRQGDVSDLLRQCIARRRMGWLSKKLRARFHQLIDTAGASLPFADCSDSEEFTYQEGMLVVIHNWPPKDIRKAYTGLATISSITKDKWNRRIFEVYDSNGKYIESVPEAVVTVPTDDDFKDVPNKRIHSNWVKWKKKQDLPFTRQKMLKGFDTIEWEQSFVWNVSAASANSSSSEIKTNHIVRALKWEISEELLFLLVKHNRLNQPFDEGKWCPLSVSLLTKCLHLIADFRLIGRDQQVLSKALMGLARDAANTIHKIVSGNPISVKNQSLSLGDLALLEKSSANEGVCTLVVDAIHTNRLAIEDYQENPQPLDVEWYLVHQVILTIHPLASLIDWGPKSGNTDSHYSVEKLCNEIGLKELSYLNYYTSKFQEWHPLLCA